MTDRTGSSDKGPLLSVVMPVYNTPPAFLNKAIQSVVGQVWEDWELCIADDGSTNEGVTEIVAQWAARDWRIKTVFTGQNGGISAASNAAAEIATGMYLAFLDHDDELTLNALAEVAFYLSSHPETDVLYSDEDKIDDEGRTSDTHLKPDWSPEMLLCLMYMCHLFVIRKALFFQVGGFRSAFDGSQDHDLALRATEVARRVGHIPKVLYHWRTHASSTASSGSAKPGAARAGQMAVEDALARRGIRSSAFRPRWAVRGECSFVSHRFPDHGPEVAIIIPTKNQLRDLRACIDSLARTTYVGFKVVVVDNGSNDPDARKYLAETPHRVLRIPIPGGKPTFSIVSNEAVKRVECDYILFLNNDTQVVSPGWLSQMVGYLGIPGVGAVGARLMFPDGLLQHTGTSDCPPGVDGEFTYRLAPVEDAGHLSATVRNYSAVTAACMLTSRELFMQVGGFTTGYANTGGADVDYCFRLIGAGYRVVYCPSAPVVHRARYLRGFGDDQDELASFWARYRAFAGDFGSAPPTDYEDVEVDATAFANWSQCDGGGESAPRIVQVFWVDGEQFSEKNSVRIVLMPDLRTGRLRFHLPAEAQGPLRLDPGSGLVCGEITSASLYRLGARQEPRGVANARQEECLAYWSESNGFAGIVAANDLMRIPCGTAYRFLSLGQDPQILFNVTLPAEEPGGYVLELTITLLEDFQETAAIELARVASELAGLDQALAREEQARAEAQCLVLEAQRERDEAVARLGAAVRQAESRLQTVSDELGHMKATRGWRLLCAYGRVKHAVLRALR